MTGLNTYLILALGGFALVWLGLTLYVLLTRLVHDLGGVFLRRAEGILVRAGARDGAHLDRHLRRAPRRLLERAAVHPDTPVELARAFAEYVLHWYSADLLRLARASGGWRRRRRIRALRLFTCAGWHAAVPLLAEALEDDDEELIAAGVAMLGRIGDRRAARVLGRALRAETFPRSRIATQLDECREPIPGLLLPLLREEDPLLRFWGATLLSRYAGGSHVVLELTRAAADGDPSVRAAAVESLAVSRSVAATATAVALLGDPVWFVRAHAARSLRDLEGNTGPAVARLLADGSWWVRAAAKETLEARPGLAFELLADYLDHADGFARNGAAEVLQNTGVLDALVAADEADGESGSLQRILRAGGPRMTATAAARNGIAPGELEQLVG